MKNILYSLLLIFSLTACTHYENRNVQQTNNCITPTCQGNSYTVRQPIEVIYKDTTYTTVYEPKTYMTTKYIRKPYNNCTRGELCK